MAKPTIVLHSCCATCAAYVLEKLSEEFNPIIFYYNPNIHPKEEYFIRKSELLAYAQKKAIPFFEEEYDPQEWFTTTKGLENEPEKGTRCNRCFELRLAKTASFAVQNKIEVFTTTLTISPHKVSKNIIEIGKKIATKFNIFFWAEDFKKKDGFKKTMEIAKRENFYRQNYCGCVYSKRISTENHTIVIPKLQ